LSGEFIIERTSLHGLKGHETLRDVCRMLSYLFRVCRK
jgi:hypothetical protein